MKCDHHIRQKWNAKTSQRPIKIIDLSCIEHIFSFAMCLGEKKPKHLLTVAVFNDLLNYLLENFFIVLI